MRRTMLVAAALSLTTLAPAGATSGTHAAQVTDLLARARAALGGEARLASVNTLVLRGSIEIGPAQSRSRTYGRSSARLRTMSHGSVPSRRTSSCA